MEPARACQPHASWHLLAIFVTSVALRWLAVAYFAEVPYSDPADYHELAQNVVRGDGYSYGPGKLTAFRACGYPLFLAAIYRVAGPDWRTAERVQAVLGGGSVLLITTLAWLVVGRREALLSGYLAAVYPCLVFLPRLLLSENLSVFLQVAALCSTVLLLRRPRAIVALALGVLLGLNLLVRGGSLFMAALVVLGVAATAGGRRFDRRGLALAALVMTATSATLAPWVARNYSVFHHFVPIATEDGITFYTSYWPPRSGGKAIWGNVPGVEDPAVAEAFRAGNEAQMSRHLRGVVLGRLLRQPSHALELIPIKLINVLVPIDWEILPHGAGRTRSINYGYLAAVFPALLGAWTLWRRRPSHLWVLWVTPAAILPLTVIFYGSPRFRLPAEPALIVFAACGLLATWDRASRRHGVAAPAAGAAGT
jgi:4-amino-4-deoxy-L-arabinose transferase-like glycosyltransferase